MRISSGLKSYPVFPNWVFEGEVAITDSILNEVIKDIDNLQLSKTAYGYATQKNKLNKATFNFNRILGSLFYDTMVSHYRLPPELQKIESVDSQLQIIKPGGHSSVCVNRHRWYSSAVFLQCGNSSSDIYLDMLDNKLYATPIGVQDYKHVITSSKLKVAFWPAHIPWGITVNNSGGDDIMFTTTFILKRG